MIFAFASWSLLRSILDQFRTHFGPPKSDQNRPQEGSEIDPKNVNQNCCVWDRYWVDFGPILDPNLGGQGGPTNQVFGVKSAPRATQKPKWPQDPSKIEFWWFGVAFGSIFDRCSATRVVTLTVNSQSNRRCATLPLHRMKTHENVKMNNTPTVLLVF